MSRALAHFDELVSGYRLAQEGALLVRRPRRLSRDAEGRLHSERGTCIEYADGWGFYAWHGVRVPPTIQTAAEAVAWSFQMSVEQYHPGQEA